MISPQEAVSLILEAVERSGKTEEIRLEESFGRTVSGDIISPLDLPPFDNSAVDGYGVCINDTVPDKWQLSREVQAGDPGGKLEGPDEAVRIFTGAPVPEGVNTVIMQEHIKVNDDTSISATAEVKKGSNIRPRGSQVEKGRVAVPAGTIISPATIGMLASLGLTTVKVTQSAVVSVITTGNELVAPGKNLPEGSIYESNSLMLKAALQAANTDEVHLLKAQDNKEALNRTVEEAFRRSEVVILTGGISVGKYDLVQECLQEHGVKEVFYKIAQKPGKPMYFGMKDNIPVFALPGNPAAVLTCFYEYVYPALKKLSGAEGSAIPKVKLPLLQKVQKKPGRTNFLKGKIIDGGVMPLSGQLSYILKSFSEANVLIVIEAEKEEVKEGEEVEVQILPFS